MPCFDGGAVDLNGDAVDGCVGRRSVAITCGCIELVQIDREGAICLLDAIDKEFELIGIEGRQGVLADGF